MNTYKEPAQHSRYFRREAGNPRNPGEIAWHDHLKHSTENIGGKSAVEVQVNPA